MTDNVEDDPACDANEDHPEECGRNLLAQSLWSFSAAAFIVSTPPMTSVALAVSFVTFLCENQPVLDSTAPLQDIRVFGVVVAFADDVRGAKLEFVGKRGSACPLNVLRVVIGSGILAAHHVDFVETFSIATNA